MKTEYEAIFTNIDKGDMRERLKKVGAESVRPETLIKQHNFGLPEGMNTKNGYLRVIDENGTIIMSIKSASPENNTNNPKEVELEVVDADQAIGFLKALGAPKGSYQESKREFWKLDGIDISIEDWPFLEPFLKIKGKNETEVRNASSWLGLDHDSAEFCAVDELYSQKYNLDKKYINDQLKNLSFKEDNPFDKQ